MKYCIKCLTTNLRPNASFSDGICIACTYSGTEAVGGSSVKLKILQNKIQQSRTKQRNKGAYDCIVGVSGGKDSTRQAHWVRDRLGLRPLLVCCAYPPKQMSEIGAKNLSNLIEMGFELLQLLHLRQQPSFLWSHLNNSVMFVNLQKCPYFLLYRV